MHAYRFIISAQDRVEMMSDDSMSLDKESFRRERKRKMMVSYRKEKKTEENELKLVYRRLELDIRALRTSIKTPLSAGVLPWKDSRSWYMPLLSCAEVLRVGYSNLYSLLDKSILTLFKVVFQAGLFFLENSLFPNEFYL